MFQGYSDETFEFFMAIRFNNNTDFFHSNHDWYRRAVREPCLALAEALGPTMEKLDDSLERRPNRVVSRINRDIRFAKDKSPYRDYLWLSFHSTDGDESTRPSFYFDISANGASYGMGYYRAGRGLMNALRRRILTEPDLLLEALEPIQGRFILDADSYRRMAIPEGVPEALRPLYPIRGFYYYKPISDFNLLKSPALADELIEGFTRLSPLQRYLSALVPEADADATVDRS